MAWSPDGMYIVFTTDRDGNLELYIVSAAGSMEKRLTVIEAGADNEAVWSIP
jgi:TolB protein